MQSRRQSEEHRRKEADRDGERHHPPVGRGIEPWRRFGPDHDGLEHQRAEPKACEAPHQGQDKTLREQLADEPAGSRADGDAQGHFALTRSATGQKQAAQIAARRREDEQDQSSDEGERGGRTDGRRVAARFAQKALALPDVPGMLPPELGGEGREFLLGHLRRASRTQAAPQCDPAVLLSGEVGEHLAPVNEVPVVREQRPESRGVGA